MRVVKYRIELELGNMSFHVPGRLQGVWHQDLEYKLHQLKVPSYLVWWIQSYLLNWCI